MVRTGGSLQSNHKQLKTAIAVGGDRPFIQSLPKQKKMEKILHDSLIYKLSNLDLPITEKLIKYLAACQQLSIKPLSSAKARAILA